MMPIPQHMIRLIICVLLLSAPVIADEEHGAAVTVRDLGPGLVSFHISDSALLGDTHFATSRRRSPAELYGFDLGRQELAIKLPISAEGAPAADGRLIAVGDDLYLLIGTDTRRTAVMRFDAASGAMQQIAEVPAAVVWDVDAAPDGKLYIASSRQSQGRLFELDPQTGDLRDMGAMETQPRQDARSVAATRDTVYVGMGFHAVDLWAVDRDTAEKSSILPPELKDQNWIYTLDASEDWIAIGTSGRPSKFAVISRRDYSDYRIMQHGGGTVQSIVMAGETVYFGGGTRVWRYDIAADKLEFLLEMPASRGLFHRDGVLHGAHGNGDIAAYELASGRLSQLNLMDAGAEAAPEWPMSLAAGQGSVFIGGRELGIIDIDSATQKQISVPGEAKSMAVAGEHLYMGMYTTGHLLRLHLGSGQIDKVAEAPPGQNRPRIVHYDAQNNLILMGTQADELQSGALIIYDPRDGSTRSTVNPFGNRAVATITSDGPTAFVAAQREDGPVAAWDPIANQRLWEITPAPGDWAMGLAALNGRLYGFTAGGTLFVVDLDDQSIIHRGRLFSGGGRLLVHSGGIYGVTSDLFFRIDPRTFEPQVIIDELNSRWFGWPSLAVDEGGRFFIIRGASVLQVEPR